jgi:hypothetical protein
MAKLTYDGTLKDHSDFPAVYAKDSRGEFEVDHKGRRVLVTPWRREVQPIKTFKLGDLQCHAGEPVATDDKGLIAKAKALGCFKVEETEVLAAPVVDEKPKKSKA